MPPKKDDIQEIIQVTEIEFNEVFNSLLSSGEIIRLNEETFILKECYEESVKQLKKYILEKGSISVGEYRDLLNTNRKTALALLEYFDQKRITKRESDKRILNEN